MQKIRHSIDLHFSLSNVSQQDIECGDDGIIKNSMTGNSMLTKKKTYDEIYRTKIDSLIGENTTIEGNLNFEGKMHIVGTVIGDINSKGEDSLLILSEGALIVGNVTVSHLIVNGQIDGNIYADKKVELFDKAQINGDVHYSLLELPVGAEVNGKLLRQGDT